MYDLTFLTPYLELLHTDKNKKVEDRSTLYATMLQLVGLILALL